MQVIQRAYEIRSKLLEFQSNTTDNIKSEVGGVETGIAVEKRGKTDTIEEMTEEMKRKLKRLQSLEQIISHIDISDVTPKEAINVLFELKEKMKADQNNKAEE